MTLNVWLPHIDSTSTYYPAGDANIMYCIWKMFSWHVVCVCFPVQCHAHCLSCSGTADHCESCRDPKAFLHLGRCLSVCPDGYFSEGRVCEGRALFWKTKVPTQNIDLPRNDLLSNTVRKVLFAYKQNTFKNWNYNIIKHRVKQSN